MHPEFIMLQAESIQKLGRVKPRMLAAQEQLPNSTCTQKSSLSMTDCKHRGHSTTEGEGRIVYSLPNDAL